MTDIIIVHFIAQPKGSPTLRIMERLRSPLSLQLQDYESGLKLHGTREPGNEATMS